MGEQNEEIYLKSYQITGQKAPKSTYDMTGEPVFQQGQLIGGRISICLHPYNVAHGTQKNYEDQRSVSLDSWKEFVDIAVTIEEKQKEDKSNILLNRSLKKRRA